MNYTKDIFFKINYNTSQDLIKVEHNSWTSKIFSKIKQNKILVLTSIAVAIFSILNFIMIYNFIKVLQDIYFMMIS